MKDEFALRFHGSFFGLLQSVNFWPNAPPLVLLGQLQDEMPPDDYAVALAYGKQPFGTERRKSELDTIVMELLEEGAQTDQDAPVPSRL